MRSKNAILIIVVGVIFIIITTVISSLKPRSKVINPVMFPSTPTVDLQLNRAFEMNFAEGVELNKSITMLRQPLLIVIDGPTPSPNEVSYIVLNHLDEAVVFNDQSFELQVFSADPQSKTWTRVSLPKAGKIRTTLPPKTERYDFKLDNSWYMPSSDFIGIDANVLRFYISGHGAKTGKQYGAYLDVTLAP